jgi:hypothetical protein
MEGAWTSLGLRKMILPGVQEDVLKCLGSYREVREPCCVGLQVQSSSHTSFSFI